LTVIRRSKINETEKSITKAKRKNIVPNRKLRLLTQLTKVVENARNNIKQQLLYAVTARSTLDLPNLTSIHHVRMVSQSMMRFSRTRIFSRKVTAFS
jgi:hypothetical protein